jgi:hypothetical protein
VEDGLPRLRFTRALAGHKSLSFEDSLAGEYLEALADSRATYSFVSVDFLRRIETSFQQISASAANLANGNPIKIMGITTALELKMSSFRVKHEFLVVGMDVHDCVPGMSFFRQVNPAFDWRKRTMCST